MDWSFFGPGFVNIMLDNNFTMLRKNTGMVFWSLQFLKKNII